MRWLDHLPLVPLAIGALVLGLAPLLPEPHLWGKFKMLVSGQLDRTTDIGDLIMHAFFPLLLCLKLARLFWTRRSKV